MPAGFGSVRGRETQNEAVVGAPTRDTINRCGHAQTNEQRERRTFSLILVGGPCICCLMPFELENRSTSQLTGDNMLHNHLPDSLMAGS